MKLEQAAIMKNEPLQAGYYLLELQAPSLVPEVQPGQFVHLDISTRKDLVLRRPFSIFKAAGDCLSLLYKVVGKGTEAMAAMTPGEGVNILGPLGHGYRSADESGCLPVLVAGGYGMAALYLVAERSEKKGLVFVGGAGKEDILCVEEFENLGWEVRVATEDGSLGARGLVTDVLDQWKEEEGSAHEPEIFACGPLGMLKAVGARAQEAGWTAWLSMDRHMGCGVGACLACAQKIRGADGKWTWARVCKEGPVFECREIVWDEGES